MNSMRKLTDRQRELLEGFWVKENVARFTREEVIPDWATVKKVFTTLGATWKKGKPTGGFHFPEEVDGVEVVRLAKKSGEIFDPKLLGFFETPVLLAEEIVRRAAIQPGNLVLEPSAGKGRIALAVRRGHPASPVMCVEILPELARVLQNEGLDVIEADFLSLRTQSVLVQLDMLELFDVVVGNPPFAGRADVRHIMHAYNFLRPGGRLAMVASAGVKYREDALTKSFRQFVEAHGAIEDLPDGSFRESDTDVRTVLVTMTKPR